MGVIGPESSRQLKVFARFAAAGFELAGCIVVGYFGGRYVDQWLESTPYLAYTGLLLGIFAGFRNLFKLARDSQPTPHDQDPPTP